MKGINLFKRIRKVLIHTKIWMHRTMSWIAMLNSAMILFLVLSKFQDYGVEIYITAWFVPIYIGLILLMILFGYIEDWAGFHREETHALAKKNPYFEDITKRLERIEKKLK